ncbi:hypothetical protein MJN51_39660, partial [Salmonella enterica subsp. enterica serovar Kentucky]|nr:hypothetical protein [Salmonella enterica subsp. enterica serovar Kentucky]
VDRCNAAQLATTVAEYFRDQGKRVVLFIDSMTRYARALRDVASTSFINTTAVDNGITYSFTGEAVKATAHADCTGNQATNSAI